MKVPKSKFHGNPSSRNRTDMCRQMDKWMDLKLICAFHNSVNAPEKGILNTFIWLVTTAPYHWEDYSHCLVSLLHPQIDGVAYDMKGIKT
jgi:hypothetical protein